MSIRGFHGINEYILYTGRVDTAGTAATIACFPIPHSGRVVGLYAVEQIAQATANVDITFEIAEVDTSFLQGGNTDLLTIGVAASAAGKVDVGEMNPVSGRNSIAAAEDGDALAAGSVLEVVTDGVGDTGFASFAIVIRRGD